MYQDISEGLIRTVVMNEFHKFANKHSDDWKDLASDYAVQMLEEIRNILNDNISLDEMHTRIMKIVMFLDTPPYSKQRKNSFATLK